MVQTICDACTADFTFARADFVQTLLQDKKYAIGSAVRGGANATVVQHLQDELERYQNDTESLDPAGSLAVCPWNPKDETSFTPYANGTWLTIWPGRTWADLKMSAASNVCQMCEMLAAMIRYAAREEIHATSTLMSIMILGYGTSRPESLQFSVSQGGKILLTLQLCIAVQDADTSRPLSSLTNPVGSSTEDESCTDFYSRALETCLGT
ncbi:hypothetical protein GGR53DRAFT_231721 [Hypoxylon sp. FL1150]|nr:hypothetical protein GGR53DRAFT_231721 [Hypoxylon sp. FL1150]